MSGRSRAPRFPRVVTSLHSVHVVAFAPRDRSVQQTGPEGGGKADLPRVKSFCGRVEGTTSSPAEETAGRRDGAGLIEGSKGGHKVVDNNIVEENTSRSVTCLSAPLMSANLREPNLSRTLAPSPRGRKGIPQKRERERKRVSRFICFTAPSSRNSSLALQNPRSIAVHRYCAKNR